MEELPLTRIVNCSSESCENNVDGCVLKTVSIDDEGRCLSFRRPSTIIDTTVKCNFEPLVRGDNHQPIPGTCANENECRLNGMYNGKQCKIKGE